MASFAALGHGGATEPAATLPEEPSLHAHALGDAGPSQPTAAMEYAIDPEAVKEAFRASGSVILSVPPGVPMVVVGDEAPIFGSRDVYEWTPEQGRVKVGEITSIAVHGTLDGLKGSAATLLLGGWGVYGEVRSAAGKYSFEPREHGLQVVQFFADPKESLFPGLVEGPRATLEDASDAHDATRPIPLGHDPSSVTTTYFWIQGDQATENAKANWKDLASSGFNQHASMWSASKVKLSLSIDGITKITGTTISSSTSCAATATNYVNYLTTYFNTVYGPWRHEAHQFWSGYGWSGTGGCAYTDTEGYANPWAVAISPMADIGTAYDVDSSHHRGVTSGHELGHVYGSTHYSETNALGKYEIMRSDASTPLNNMAFFFGSGSRSDINCRYYHNDNTPPC